MSTPHSGRHPQSVMGWLRVRRASINGQAAMLDGRTISIRRNRFFRPFSTHGLHRADAGMGVCLKCHGMAKDALSDFP
jgi:hypothetical protein